MRRLPAIIAAVVVAACGAAPTQRPGPAAFDVILTMGDGRYPLPVRLVDHTGLVVALAPVPFDGTFREDGLHNPEGEGGTLILVWVGGACDTRTHLTFRQADDRFTLIGETERRAEACILIGLGRQVAIRLTAPVDADSVHLELP